MTRLGLWTVLVAVAALVVSFASPAMAASPEETAGIAAAASAARAAGLDKASKPGGPTTGGADTGTPGTDAASDARQDLVSARIAARAAKKPIEVLDARTESSTTWALPTGALRKDSTPEPVRVARPDGSWSGIDLKLVAGKDGWVPSASPRPVVFSAGGKGPLVVFEHNGRTLTTGWPGTLPTPTIAGATATYALSATQNLVLTAVASGFEQSLVITSRPAAGDDTPQVVLPLTVDGVSGASSQAGTVSFTATTSDKAGTADRVKSGDEVFSMPRPVVFSAARDKATGQPTQVKALTPKVVLAPTTGDAAGADLGVTLSPDPVFLADPDTVYPVTIDPVISAVDAVGDTWVQDTDTSPHGVNSTLYSGAWSSHPAWSLVRFSDAKFHGNHVTSASLSLYNTYTGSCTASGLPIFAIDQDWNPSTVVWTTRPTINWSGPTAYGYFAHGFSGSCPAATESIDVTDIVSAWSFATQNNYGFLLDADDTDAAQAKSFCAMDLGAAPCNTSTRVPTLSVTYNSYPWDPQAPSVNFSPKSIGTTGATFATSLNPTLSAQVGNTDGAPITLNGEVSYDPAYPGDGSGTVWTGTGQAIEPLATATVQVSTALTTGKHYRYRVRGGAATSTGGTDYGAWSGYQTFVVDTTKPNAPGISCASYPSNAWTVSTGGAVSCSLSTTSTDGAGYLWGLDDPTAATLQNNGTSNGATQSISINPVEGTHTLYARTRDAALQQSATTTAYTFGVGKGGFLSPKPNDQTQASIATTVQSQSSFTTFKLQYQAGTGGSTWTDVPLGNLYPVGSGTPISAWPGGTVTGSVSNYPTLNWNVAATLSAAGKSEGAVQVRVVFNPSGTSWTSAATTFVLAKTAFSGTAAQSSVGPGTVSLVTGDYAVDDTDASYGGLTIGRTNTNLSPPAASTGPSGIFGAGWTTAAFGPDAGVGMYTLTDNAASGSVTLSDSSGTKATYTGTAGGNFTGIGDAADGSILLKATSTTWTLTQLDGTVTTWTQQAATNAYNTSQVQEPGTEGTTQYTRDANSRVTQIIGAAPTGVTCTSASLVRGCRALLMTYASATTATGTAEAQWGNYTGLITKIEYTSWDPSTSAMATTQIANYLYDSTGHLRAEWDPRVSPALKTRYTYDASGRLATLTEPGRAAWTLAYDTSGRLASASRLDPNTSLTATAAVAYGIPLSGTNLPDVTAGTAATWGQSSDQAYSGAAVFPASHVPTTGGSGTYAPVAGDWQYADLSFYDVNGRPVNTATYGAGAWQITTSRYDAKGNTTWALTARNRAQALTPTADTDWYAAAQSSSAARADLLATINTYSSDGVDLLTALAPTRPLYVHSGTLSSVRVKTTNTYDQGSPLSGTYHLVTSTTVASVPQDGASTDAYDTRTTTTGYDPIDGASTTGNTSGWTHKTPTVTTTQMSTSPGASDIVHKTLLDSSGRVLESRMPESNAADAGTTVNVYYTSAANGTYPACGGHAEWAGLICQSGPKAQPAGTTIPTTATTYNRWDQALVATETSGASSRTTTNGYDSAARPTTVTISASPAGDAGSSLPTTTTGYDASTGDATTLTDGTTTITTVYNSIGQVTSYTDADAQASTSTYDIDGNLKTLNDGKGIYTYNYDGTDANGTAERRGLLTSLNVGISPSPTTFTAAYDADSNLAVQNYPGDLQQKISYDNADDQRVMTYAKTGIQWMRFDSGADRDGHTVGQGSPGSFTQYGYDNNDRLTNVWDTVNGQCTTRAYTFSKNGNRTALTTGQPATDGSCQTSTTTSANTTYDTADRDTTTGYTYDKFGRTLTVPATDTSAGSGGSALSVGYYSNDMVATQTQGSKSKTFTLDPGRRLRAATDTTSGTETRRIINHYNNTDDTPTWINTSINTGTSWTWQRNITGIDGNLSILQDQAGTPQIQLANPHGDIVATTDDTTAATSTNVYFEQTEYGAPRSTNTTNPTRYGWLGAKQRSSDDLAGIALMGVRLYNPATGKFLSVDPVPGGNENDYDYPNNPIDSFDLLGQWSVNVGGILKNRAKYYYRQAANRTYNTLRNTYHSYAPAARASGATFRLGFDVTMMLDGASFARHSVSYAARNAARRGGRHAGEISTHKAESVPRHGSTSTQHGWAHATATYMGLSDVRSSWRNVRSTYSSAWRSGWGRRF